MLGFVASWLTPTSCFLFLNLMIGTIAITSRFTNRKPQKQQQQQQQPQQSHYYYHENQQQPYLARTPSLLERVRSINFSLYNFPVETAPYYTHYPQDPQPDYPTLIKRSPSFLERVKSMTFSLPNSSTETTPDSTQYPEPECSPRLERKPSLLERVKSINFRSYYRVEHEPEAEVVDGSGLVSDSCANMGHGSEQHHEVKRSKSETEKRVSKEVKVGKMKKSASERAVAVEAEVEEEEVERGRLATKRVEKTAYFGEQDDDDQDVDAKANDFINRFKQQLKLQRLDSLLRWQRDAQREAKQQTMQN